MLENNNLSYTAQNHSSVTLGISNCEYLAYLTLGFDLKGHSGITICSGYSNLKFKIRGQKICFNVDCLLFS